MKPFLLLRNVPGLGLACLLGLSGCGAVTEVADLWEDDVSRIAPLLPVVNRIALTPIWSYRMDDYEDYDSQVEPWIDSEHVYLADLSGEVVALRRETGQLIWKREIEGRLLAGVTADSKQVYVGTWEREVFALDRESGAILWQQTLASEVLRLYSVSDEHLAVRTNDGRITLLRSEDGESQWSHVHSNPSLTLRGAGKPMAEGDRVITGFDDGRLISFSAADGRQHWDARLAIATGRTELERIVDIDGALRIDQGVVYAAAMFNQVGAVEMTEGQVLWRHDVSIQGGPALDDVAVYVTDTEGAVWSLNRSNGGVYWRQGDLAYRGLSAPAVAGLYVIVVDFEGYLHWMQITDGTIVARHPLDSPLQAPPEVYQGRIYLLHKNGEFGVYQYVPLPSSEPDDTSKTDG